MTILGVFQLALRIKHDIFVKLSYDCVIVVKYPSTCW